MDQSTWNVSFPSSLVPSIVVDHILSIPLSDHLFEDKFVWGLTANGTFLQKKLLN